MIVLRVNIASLLLVLNAQFVLASRPAADLPEQGPRTVTVSLGDYAQIYYVSSDSGSDSQGVGSKESPWGSLSKALDEARGASEANRIAILVSQGRYDTFDLRMLEYVDLYGGFDSIDWQRDLQLNMSILHGRGKNRIFRCANHSRIDLFTISEGTVRGKGGALLCDGVSPTVTNNRFRNNRTLTPLNWNPSHIHVRANDGGAICVENGSSPTITNNLFVGNQTETGRGAAIAIHDHCGGTIKGNVFLANTSGTNDKHRSSDGGAVSVFKWSNPKIKDNLFIENRALGRNDGGALFCALWSSPSIVRNTFVGNQSTDDAGALFIGGQEHRYDRPKDPMPKQEEFIVVVKQNMFYGNSNSADNSGGCRVTMQARAKLLNNIFSENDQLAIQSSEVTVTNNTVMGRADFAEFFAECEPRLVSNNILWGGLHFDSQTPISYSNVRGNFPGPGNLSDEPLLETDQYKLDVSTTKYLGDNDTTRLETSLEVSKFAD